MENVLHVHNPNNLPTMPYTEFAEFQGDLKNPITPEDLEKMRGSLKDHGVFVPKFIWFDADKKANILDGHQTKQALSSLEKDGWTIPEIPYVLVDADSRQDAARKLLQINSRYATMNIDTTWFDEMDFPDISEVLGEIQIPDFDLTASSPIEFPEYDESIADGVEVCTCPTCGHEHTKS